MVGIFMENITETDERYPDLLDRWLEFYLTPGVGIKTFHKNIKQDLFLKGIAANLPQGLKAARTFRQKHIDAGIVILPSFDQRYPRHLKLCHDFPPFLFCYGNVDVLNHSYLSIVGTRRASLVGMKWVMELSKDLAREGFIIASGLARGIDGAAHEGALLSGSTVAVVAGGVDILYPKEHAKLYEAIKEKGCIISEEPMGTQPSAGLFPKRN